MVAWGDGMNFGEKLRNLRKSRGMTLEEVGNLVGVGKSTVRKWESGEIANMRRDKIALIAKALGVSPSYLMGWDDNAEDITADEYWAWREDLRRNPEKRTMFDLTKNASRSQMREINAFIRGLRTSNDYEEDPD